MTNHGDGRRHEVHREELYAQVWSEPMVRLAKRYGVSDVALAKVCRKLDIPVPPRGYWRRLETGWRPMPPPLPKARPGVGGMTTITPQPRQHSSGEQNAEIAAQEAFRTSVAESHSRPSAARRSPSAGAPHGGDAPIGDAGSLRDCQRPAGEVSRS